MTEELFCAAEKAKLHIRKKVIQEYTTIASFSVFQEFSQLFLRILKVLQETICHR